MCGGAEEEVVFLKYIKACPEMEDFFRANYSNEKIKNFYFYLAVSIHPPSVRPSVWIQKKREREIRKFRPRGAGGGGAFNTYTYTAKPTIPPLFFYFYGAKQTFQLEPGQASALCCSLVAYVRIGII